MTYKQLIIPTLMTLCIIFGVLILFQGSTKKVEAGSFMPTNIGYVATSSAIVSVTTTTRLAATTTTPLDPTNSYTRVYTTICTQSSNPVAIRMDGDKPTNATTLGYTAWIAAAAGYNSCYEITDRNMYLGSITASSTSQAATAVSVSQYVQ